jgi:hypothetical protein
MQKATAQSKAEEVEDKSGVTNIFNILDQSIQENIQLKSFNYDDDE